METLKYQIAEIEKAELEPGEDERLEDRRKILQNAEKLSNTDFNQLFRSDNGVIGSACHHVVEFLRSPWNSSSYRTCRQRKALIQR